ncbi:MAG: peptidoglycan-binding protein [Paracoccaceae bacterium]|nr:peptidoglycan-binding protein [Paracoccaceae bacterium]
MNAAFSRTLRYKLPMMQGGDVRALQDALVLQGILHHAGVDGLFGPGTKKAIASFQRQSGLAVTGVADAQTFAALIGGRPPDVDSVAPQPGLPATSAGRKIPTSWMPAAPMTRIILHWTGGTHSPSSSEKKHYHILIDGEGEPHRGKLPISANVPPLRSGAYAAHTFRANSHSIGVSLCAMGGNARENPFRSGPFPITRAQWEMLAQVAAELCLRYGIPVTRKTVLGHGEVQNNLGIEQNGKWDPLALPWDPQRPYIEVGDGLRARAQEILDALKHPMSVSAPPLDEEEIPPSETVTLDGVPLRGAAIDGRIFLDMAHLVEHKGWPAPLIDVQNMSATIATPSVRFAIVQMNDRDGFTRHWIEAAEVSERLGMPLREDDAGDLHLASIPDDGLRRVIVKRGQTLGQIAQQHLGDRTRWRDLLSENGDTFTEDTARRLSVGQIVILPDGTKPVARSGTPLKPKGITDIAQKIARLEGGGTSMQQTRANAVKAILSACQSQEVNDLSHQAYILATAYHETNLGQFMTELWGPTKHQKTYGSRLGNRSDKEGRLYLGRGFVQITGRHNYGKYGEIFKKDFLSDPEQVADPAVAAEILVRGMSEIGFTGKGLLADLGFDGDFDWFRARSLINGDMNHRGDDRYPGLKKGEGIAKKARKYREIIATT